MRRGCAGALWVLVLSCSAGGDPGGGTVVIPENGGGPAAMGGTGGASVGNPNGGTGNIFDDDELACTGGCAFPAAAILEGGLTEADVTAFSATGFASGSLCVLEPQLSNGAAPGAMFPSNWLRPRFRWATNGGETLWEVRLSHESQPQPLRAYTRDTQWIMPQAVWDRMATINTPVTVTIRGLGAGGVLSGTEGTFSVAPVEAGGSMIFWATTTSVVDRLQPSRLLGFSVGDEGVVETLRASDVATTNVPGEDGASPRGFYACGDPTVLPLRPTCAAEPNNPACCTPTGYEYGQVECVGCHVSTPDGKAVLFTDNWPWNKVAASVEPLTTGQLPATITPYAANLLKQPWLGMQALSPAYFSDAPGGPRILVTSYGVRANPVTAPFEPTPPTRHELAWFDLTAEADPTAVPPLPPIPEEIPYPQVNGQPDIYAVRTLRQAAVGAARGRFWGPLTTIGENGSAVTPTWSNDGVEIAYVSTDVTSSDGHPDWTANAADIRVVNYEQAKAPAGAASTLLEGASDPQFLEYYPEYSVDDALIAFARAPRPSVATRCVPSQASNGVVTLCPEVDLGENPDGPYYNRNGEIYVVKRGGSAPIRLAANDPVSCSGETSRGSINSWPKWSPRKEQLGGKTYYFLIFSSARQYPGAFAVPRARLTPAISNKSSQLYMAPIVVDDATGAVTTYPAVYLWNQNIHVDAAGGAVIEQTSNLTPAWDDFSIPEVPVPIQIPR